jgi:hypothetical protein
VGALQSVALGALDVHLDKVDSRQPKLIDKLVQGEDRNRFCPGGSVLLHQAVPGGIVVDLQFQRPFLVPYSSLNQLHAAAGHLSGEVRFEHRNVNGRRLDSYDAGSAALQSITGEGADVGAAVDHGIARVDGDRAVFVVVLDVQFPNQPSEKIFSRLGNPEIAEASLIEAALASRDGFLLERFDAVLDRNDFLVGLACGEDLLLDVWWPTSFS